MMSARASNQEMDLLEELAPTLLKMKALATRFLNEHNQQGKYHHDLLNGLVDEIEAFFSADEEERNKYHE